MLKKLFSHTAIYGIAPQVTRLVSFFTLPIITQDLTAIDYGVMGVITSYTAALTVLATLGLRLILMNSFYQSPSQYKWAWKQIYGFLLLWNLLYALLLCTLIYFVVPAEAIEQRMTIILLTVAPIVFFGPVAEIGSTFFQVKQNPWQVASRSIVAGMLIILFNVLFITHWKLGFMGWFWSSFLTGILINLSYFYPMYFVYDFTPIFNFKRRTIKKYLKISLPVIPHSYSSYLLDNSDRVVMNLLNVSTANIGKFNIAYMFGNVVSSIGMASGMAIGPLMNEKFKKRDDTGARDLVFGLQVAFFLMTFLLCLWLKEVFHFMIRNEELSQMYPLGIIIIMSFNYRPMYFGANAALFFAEKTNVLWRVTFIAGAGNVILNFLTIPFFGYQAAAYTTYLALLYMGYAGFYFKVFNEVNKADYYPIRWMLVSILLTAISYFVVELNWGIKSCITAGAIGLVITLFIQNRQRYS